MIKIYVFYYTKNQFLFFATIDDMAIKNGYDYNKVCLRDIIDIILNGEYHLDGEYIYDMQSSTVTHHTINLIAEFENKEDLRKQYKFKLAEYLI